MQCFFTCKTKNVFEKKISIYINKLNTLLNINCKGSDYPFFLAEGYNVWSINGSDLGVKVEFAEWGKPEKNSQSQININKVK